MDLVLGLDIGTTEVKAMTWDAACQHHAVASCKVNLCMPQAGWVEQDPNELWAAVIKVCAQVAADAKIKQDSICALSVSTQGGTTIPVDAAGEPTHPALSWMDERAVIEARDLNDRYGREKLYRNTGWPLIPGLPINQIAWFRKNRPDAYRKTTRFMFVSDYILWKLGNVLAMDPSNAGITQLYNLHDNGWDTTLLEIAGVQCDQLSPILPSGSLVSQLTHQAAGMTGLAPGIPIFNGAHDQYCAALGSGATDPGDVMLSCGTAWVLLFILENLEKGFEKGLSVSRHPIEGVFGGIQEIGGVGSTMEWVISNLWEADISSSNRFSVLEQAVATSTPGANGLLFVPLCGGYLQPDENIRRGPAGLSLNHTRADIARAAMEGIAMELDLLLAEGVNKIPIQRLIMIGGAARNPYWPQINADITGLPVVVPQAGGSASLGAARLAMKALNWDTNTLPGKTEQKKMLGHFNPDPDRQQLYQQVKTRYRQSRKCLP